MLQKFCAVVSILVAHHTEILLRFSQFEYYMQPPRVGGCLPWWRFQNWSDFSKKRQYFWIICVESNLIFYRQKIWSFLKVLDYQILEELTNLRIKCSFLSLVQIIPRVQVPPFYGSLPNAKTNLNLKVNQYSQIF